MLLINKHTTTSQVNVNKWKISKVSNRNLNLYESRTRGIKWEISNLHAAIASKKSSKLDTCKEEIELELAEDKFKYMQLIHSHLLDAYQFKKPVKDKWEDKSDYMLRLNEYKSNRKHVLDSTIDSYVNLIPNFSMIAKSKYEGRTHVVDINQLISKYLLGSNESVSFYCVPSGDQPDAKCYNTTNQIKPSIDWFDFALLRQNHVKSSDLPIQVVKICSSIEDICKFMEIETTILPHVSINDIANKVISYSKWLKSHGIEFRLRHVVPNQENQLISKFNSDYMSYKRYRLIINKLEAGGVEFGYYHMRNEWYSSIHSINANYMEKYWLKNYCISDMIIRDLNSAKFSYRMKPQIQEIKSKQEFITK